MMKLFALLVLVAATTANPVNPTGRIIGGFLAAIEDFPYQASVRILGSHMCGASIISPDWILTSAQCAVFPPGWYAARVGSAQANSGGSLVNFESIVSHPRYNRNARGIFINDIALAKVQTIQFDVTRMAIALFNANVNVASGALGVVTGYGADQDGGLSTGILHGAAMSVPSKEICSSALDEHNVGPLSEGHICTIYANDGLDTCRGDEGGPLVVGGRLAGIISTNLGCQRAGSPTLYTEVASYRSWITEVSGL